MNLGNTGFLLIAMTGTWGHTSGTATVAGNWLENRGVSSFTSTAGSSSSGSFLLPVEYWRLLKIYTNLIVN